MDARTEIEQAIATLEAQRATLGDAVVDASVDALREKLSSLDTSKHLEQQRKQVTVLVMDVVGSTSMIGELDPEDNLALMDSALRRLAEPVNQYGGRVTRYMGDGFLALFGHPVASEFDPDNAVRAALAILAEAARYRREIADQWNLADFNVRVGIDSGLAIIGGETEGENTLAGTTVNLATRLESAADPGSVWISDNTYQLVRGVFDLAPVESFQAKGFAQPIRAYRVIKAKARSFRTRRRGVEGVATRLIARESEMGNLKDAYAEVVDRKNTRMLTVVGEAGLGKSRLLFEFENWADLQPADMTLFRGRARHETRHLSNSLFRDLFAFRFGLQNDDPPDRIVQKFVAGFAGVLGEGASEDKHSRADMKAHIVGQVLGYRFNNSPYVEPLLNEPRQLRDRALVYIADFFRAAADAFPILLLLEDLHWADDSSLEILYRLVLSLQGHPALVLTAARPELFERQPDWMVGQAFHTRIDLPPLSPLESSLLTKEVLQKVDVLPDALRDLIVANAEGNPFFVEELVKMLIEEGVVVTGTPSWEVRDRRLDELDIPPTLTGVIQARLDALPKEERIILQRASVIGRVFWEQSVCYLNPEGEINLDSATVSQGLRSLQTRELVFPQETSAFAETSEHIFKHALLRDVTYESVLRHARRHYHSLAADWLIKRSEERAGEISGLIGDHLERAGRTDEALAYFQKGAALAASAYANEAAVGFYSHALDLLDPNDQSTRVELLLARARIHSLCGNRDAQQADLEALAALVATMNDRRSSMLVALEQATYAYDIGSFQDALEASNAAVALAADLNNVEQEILGRRLMGLTLTQLGRYDEAHDCLGISLALSRKTGDERGEGLTNNALGPVFAARGAFDQAGDHYQQAVTMAIRSGDRYLEGGARNNLGTIAKYVGDYSTSMVHFEAARAIAAEIGDRQGESIALLNSGVIAADLGMTASAADTYRAALSIAKEIGDRRVERIALGNLGGIHVIAGAFEQALARYEAALSIAKELGDRYGEANMLDGLGEAWLGMGNPATASALIREALHIRHELGQTHLVIESRGALAWAELELGNVVEAREQVAQILDYLDKGGSLEGTSEPQQILWRCIQVLQATHDSRWESVLAQAYDELQTRIEGIQDAELRQSFSQQIPWHRELLALWEETKGDHS